MLHNLLIAGESVALGAVVISGSIAAAGAFMARGVRTGRIHRHPAPPAPPAPPAR